jgi:hypothetical protein
MKATGLYKLAENTFRLHRPILVFLVLNKSAISIFDLMATTKEKLLQDSRTLRTNFKLVLTTGKVYCLFIPTAQKEGPDFMFHKTSQTE